MNQAYLRWRPLFAEAVNPDFHRIEELDEKVANGALLWASEKAAIVAEVQELPSGLSIHGLCAAGDLGEIVDKLIPAAEEWARRAECKYAVIESRSGWVRALKESGYVPHTIAVRKEL